MLEDVWSKLGGVGGSCCIGYIDYVIFSIILFCWILFVILYFMWICFIEELDFFVFVDNYIYCINMVDVFVGNIKIYVCMLFIYCEENMYILKYYCIDYFNIYFCNFYVFELFYCVENSLYIWNKLCLLV